MTFSTLDPDYDVILLYMYDDCQPHIDSVFPSYQVYMNSLASFIHLHPNISCTNQRLVCAYCTRAIDVTRSAIPNPSNGPS